MNPVEMMPTERPLPHDLGLAELEAVIVAKYDRHLVTQQPTVERSGNVGGKLRYLAHFGGIARIDHRHVRNRAHQREIVDRLVRSAVAGGDPGQRGEHLHVGLAVCTRDRHEVVRAARCEAAVRRAVGDVSGLGESGGDGDERLFCHSDVEEAIRIEIAEGMHVGVLAEIGGERHHVAVLALRLDQALRERRFHRPAMLDGLDLAHSERATLLRHFLPPAHGRSSPTRRARLR